MSKTNKNVKHKIVAIIKLMDNAKLINAQYVYSFHNEFNQRKNKESKKLCKSKFTNKRNKHNKYENYRIVKVQNNFKLNVFPIHFRKWKSFKTNHGLCY